MHKPVRTVAPASQPVTLAEAKAQLRILHDNQDTEIAALIADATAVFDGWSGDLGLALVEQTWRQDFDAFATTLRLPVPPVLTVTSITYQDAADETQTVDSDDYSLLADDLGSYVQFGSTWTAPALANVKPAVTVTYTAGHATVPRPICRAILLLLTHWHDNGTAVSDRNMQDVPFTVHALTDRYRHALLA